jgi:transposase
VTKSTTMTPALTIGLDLGDRTSQACVLDNGSGDVLERFGVQTTQVGLTKRFGATPASRIVIEAGTHSPWSSRLLTQLGHAVIVANPRKVRLIGSNERKSDRVDAETLARLGRADEKLLHPIQHRGERNQEHLGILRARDQVVGTRTALINHVRGRAKASGTRLPAASAEAFPVKVAEVLPAALHAALGPVLALLREMTATIHCFDEQIEALCEKEYPETVLLRKVKGVGPVTSLAFVLVLGSHERFTRSRMVGAYLGMCPRKEQSGDRDPQLPITKAGDVFLRRLLVGSAHYILGPFGPDCALRRVGERLMTRGAGNGKKRAVVAVARRLACLLHHLWRTAEVYDPMRGIPAEAVTN